jgi:hypothetical protein
VHAFPVISTAGRRGEHAAGLGHACRSQGRDTPPEGGPGDGVEVVEVNQAARRDPVVVSGEFEFGDEASFRAVSAATTTVPMRSATGSLVSTRTGRSPPGICANQTSPRCIGPVRPVFGGTPVRHRGQGPLPVVEGGLRPCDGIDLAGQPQKMSTERLSEQLGPVESQALCPRLRKSGLRLVDPKTEHRHTFIMFV